MFTPQEIQARLRGRPFVPVRFVTTTGETYDVHHPDMALVARRYVDIGVPAVGMQGVAELINRVAILHITEMRDLPTPSSAPNTNGPTA